MAFNPQRSWAVTYNQMWNLSMRDPIPKNGAGNRPGYGNFHQGNQNNAGPSNFNNNNHQKKGKSNYCWNFNKGVPCKFGNKCKFIEHCKYYNSPSHGVHNCQKLAKRMGESSANKGTVAQESGTN